MKTSYLKNNIYISHYSTPLYISYIVKEVKILKKVKYFYYLFSDCKKKKEINIISCYSINKQNKYVANYLIKKILLIIL